MARHRSRGHRTRSRSRRMAGGKYFDAAPARAETQLASLLKGGASSAATYEMGAVGPLDAQYSRVFDQAGPYGNIPGNSIIGTGGQGIESASRIPTAQNLALIQSAGRSRHRGGNPVYNPMVGGRRRRRGGFLGEVINQALPPAILLGMQQTYRRKRSGGRRTRRNRRRH